MTATWDGPDPPRPVRLSASKLDEDRFDRAARLGWFDIRRMRGARVVVVGCGALGNEVVKNLALSGVGRLDLVDMDRVVPSNLPRCALFTQRDAEEARAKAGALAEAAARLDPECVAVAHVLPVEKVDEEILARADVLLSCLDNIGARVWLSAKAMALGKPLVDGATRGTIGKVQVVRPGLTPCLECNMNATHMRVVNDRASCTGRDVAVFEPKMAADLPTTAVVSAVQARETIKILHGKWESVLPGMLYYDGMANVIESLELSVNPACPHHSTVKP